jgi:hypothetical protein
MQQLITGLFVVWIQFNMFRTSSCPSSGAYQLQQQPLVYRRNVVVTVLLVVFGPAGPTKTKCIKGERISWLGHVKRMEEDRMPKKIFTQELEGTRRRKRPRKDGEKK